MRVVDGIIVSRKNRRVKDVVFSLFFILYWIGILVIAGLSLYHGNLQR
jgi:hypothetical protein